MFIAKEINGMSNTHMDPHMRWILFYIMVAPPHGGDHMIMKYCEMTTVLTHTFTRI